MKKYAALILFLCLLLLVFPVFAGENLLINGGFEDASQGGIPREWYSTAYRSQVGISVLKATTEAAHSGQYSVLIENTDDNDARFLYDADVKPNTLYKLSAWVKVDQPIEGGIGANLALEDFICTSKGITEATDGWELLEWYGQTGENQTLLTFGVRLGGFGRESIGKVYFDDVCLEETDKLPEGVYATAWFEEESDAASAAYDDEEEATDTDTDTTLQRNLVIILLCVPLYLLIFYFLRRMLPDYQKWIFALLMLIALVLRVILSLTCQGYQVDIGCFEAWSTRIASVGPSAFYAEDYFCDYPPLAMLLLYPIGLILNRIGLQSSYAQLVVKSLPILTDLLSATLLWLYAQRKRQASALLLAGLILLNPAALVTGSAWGQIDSLLTLFLLAAALLTVERKLTWAIPVYVLAVLIKPQALLVGPIALAWLIFQIVRSPKRSGLLKQCAIGIAISAGLALAVVLPFAIYKEQPLQWFLKLYTDALSSYNYAVLNAANFYYLIGANWTDLASKVPQAVEIVLAVFAVGIAALLFVKNRKDRYKLSFAVLFLLLGLFLAVCCLASASYGLLGYGLMAFVYLFVILCLFKDRDSRNLPFYLALVLTGLFVFAVKIHERYLYPALLLYLLAYILTGDKRMIFLCVGFSLTSFVNTAVILNNSVLLGSAYGHLSDNTALLNLILCIANLLMTGYAFSIALNGVKEAELPSLNGRIIHGIRQRNEIRLHQLESSFTGFKLRLRWYDYAIMGGVTLLYALLCFQSLGSTVAPQTAYVSSSADEQVILELPQEEEFSLLYYGGVSYHDFSVAVSSDGVNWEEEVPCQMDEGLCYRWLYAVSSTQDEDGISYASSGAENVVWFSGRYIRLNALRSGLNLWEIVARNRDGENLKLKLVSQSGLGSEEISAQYPASHLVDEPESCVGEPSWYNGTYFDEIYYARTAWEFTQGQSIYETSHPPLGKLMMAASVKIFGMTPFAWRFPGALLGTLMLPLMYLLAYQLLHKRSAAVAAMGAMTLGLMHFTQTRIATIDTFPVFFIMLSFFFLLRYLQSDFFAVDDAEDPKPLDSAFLRGLLPLLGSGVSMGLAIASKWIGMYAAVGLAILFFSYIIRRWMQYRSALKLSGEKQADCSGRIATALNVTPKRVTVTALFCVLSFILLPALIYYLCYIPYFVSSGGITLKKLINTQISMFNYHSSPGLGMDHPFYSPWWQWPLLMKPMWFVQDAYEPTGYASTILVFGNQWVFYLGALAVIAVLIYSIFRLVKGPSLLECADQIKTPFFILVAFAVQFLPWMLVPRGTYMYHYFACAPFLVLATAWCIAQLKQPKQRWLAVGIYLLGALVCFGYFFPYASGLLTEKTALDQIRSVYAWMKNIPGFSSYFNLWY